MVKTKYFLALCVNISKTVQDTTKVTTKIIVIYLSALAFSCFLSHNVGGVVSDYRAEIVFDLRT